jgi:hypothetical protein
VIQVSCFRSWSLSYITSAFLLDYTTHDRENCFRPTKDSRPCRQRHVKTNGQIRSTKLYASHITENSIKSYNHHKVHPITLTPTHSTISISTQNTPSYPPIRILNPPSPLPHTHISDPLYFCKCRLSGVNGIHPRPYFTLIKPPVGIPPCYAIIHVHSQI